MTPQGRDEAVAAVSPAALARWRRQRVASTVVQCGGLLLLMLVARVAGVRLAVQEVLPWPNHLGLASFLFGLGAAATLLSLGALAGRPNRAQMEEDVALWERSRRAGPSRKSVSLFITTIAALLLASLFLEARAHAVLRAAGAEPIAWRASFGGSTAFLTESQKTARDLGILSFVLFIPWILLTGFGSRSALEALAARLFWKGAAE